MSDSEHSTDNGQPREETLRQLSVLSDPVRQSLYQAVSEAEEPITREAAAQATGLSRTLSAYHLDLLVEAKLLGTAFARPDGAGGPGAGRPAKHYFRIKEERSISVPPRDYQLLADLLATAYDHDEGGAVHTALLNAAGQQGRHMGASIGAGDAVADELHGPASLNDLCELLHQRGYEPVMRDNGDIDMRNCPFDRLSRSHTNLVCGLNHALLSGVLEGSGDDANRAQLCPRTGHCCVVIRAGAPTPDASSESLGEGQESA